MSRKPISANIKRKLWAQCGGYCQNPSCNKYLFAEADDSFVNLANIAHIIGYGKAGPRSEDEIAELIDKNSTSNLIMLCLDCHKIVDELEEKYTVEEMQKWKLNHFKRIRSIFSIRNFDNEHELLKEINGLLDENRLIFEEYGPYSSKALDGSSGDVQIIWRRRCLDTILPKNKRIIDLLEGNRQNFEYPWEFFQLMLMYKIHANSFRENCLFDEKINDYKLFPQEFDYYVKKQLGIPVKDLEIRESEEIEIRSKTITDYIQRFLANHSFIAKMEEWNKAIFEVTLIDGRTLRVFVTNTYYFTEYTLEKILTVDPNINAIICSTPYSEYSESAKRQSIRSGIGLFMLREFMGAIHTTGDKFLNYLVNADRNKRISYFSSRLKKNQALNSKCRVYLFGSYLRHKVFDDIDMILVYKNGNTSTDTDTLIREISNSCENYANQLDFTVCSEDEFLNLNLDFDNKVQIF